MSIWCNTSRNAPLYRVHFSSELTSCRQTRITCWGKWNAMWLFYFHAVFLMSFRSWNTNWAFTWGMRCSVMFILVKTSSTEEGMIAFTRARCVTAQTREQGLIAAARVNACVGFIPALFWIWTVPEAQKVHVYRTERPVPKQFGTNTCTVTPLITGNKYLWPVNFLNSIIAVKSILRMGCWIDIMIWLLSCWEIHIFGSTMCLEPISKMTCLFLSLCVSLTSLSPRSAPLALSLMSTVSVCRLRLICVVVQTLADPNTLTKQTSPSFCPLLCLSCFSFAPIYPRETKGQK